MRAVACGTMVMLVVGLFGACAADPPPAPLGERLQRLDADLQLGSRGEGVRAVHDYLTAYGYFPNVRLAAAYPSWRPLVGKPPLNPSLFDERTLEAIRKLQFNMGIPVTGVVDEATRAVLRADRCAFPDGAPDVDEDNKFAHSPQKWNKSTLSWWLENVGNTGFTREQIKGEIRQAFAVWAEQTSLTFTESFSTTPDIVIRFGQVLETDNVTVSGVGGVAGRGAFPPDGDITLDRAETWTLTNGSAPTVWLRAVLVHEIGHALGLRHSRISPSIMHANSTASRVVLSLDDKVGISSRYDTYIPLGGWATDIGANGTGDMWVIGRNPIGNDFGVWKVNGPGSMTPDAEGAGMRIAVDFQGRPWVVGRDGSIWRKLTTDPTVLGRWERLPGCVADVGAAPGNGNIWIVDCDTSHAGGGFVWKWNETTRAWTRSGFVARRITVDEDGRPWVVTGNGKIYRHSNNQPTTGTWEELPGTATDLAIGRGNYLWSIGPVSSGQENLAVWNEQMDGVGDGPFVRQWAPGIRIGVGGPNAAVTVGRNGRPFLVDNDGAIWMTADEAP